MNNLPCNSCGFPTGGCGKCGQCQPKCGCDNKCPKQCGCPESILSIEADSANPTNLRFNLGGRSVWYDFDSLVKAGQTCTAIIPDAVNRGLRYSAECQDNFITAQELGSIFHLADIGDVDATSFKDNALLVYRKDANCGENCDGKNGWIGVNPAEEGKDNLEYILGSDSEGDVASLMPPANANHFSYLTWASADKAMWKNIREVPTAPTKDGYAYRLYLDPQSGEIVYVKEKVS